MTDQEKKEETSITPQPDAEKKQQSGELSEEELKKAAGGYGHIVVTYTPQKPDGTGG